MEAQYAVRGALVLRAMQHQRALENNEKMPFDEIIYCNIGNPHQLKQKPITFFRQVLALVDYPELATLAPDAFPPDAVQRALTFLENCPGGTGAYSESQGILHIRQHVAEFISRRDGVTASADDIFLSDGASQVVRCLRRPSDAYQLSRRPADRSQRLLCRRGSASRCRS
jgi:alanine transaminase